MVTLAEVAPEMTGREHAHLTMLMRTWAPLADISFADLLLCVPDDPDAEISGYTVAGHVRPTTSPSIYRTEMVGHRFEAGSRPFFDMVRASPAIIDGGLILQPEAPRIRTLAVPVCCEGRVIAVLSRDFSPGEQRAPGELEMNYFFLFRRLAQMIAEGTYPYPADEDEIEEAPRVSDGLLLLDASGRVRFASPNAVSVLSRLGVSHFEGQRLTPAGIPQRAVRQAFASRLPETAEIERDGQVVVLRVMPIIEGGELTGAVGFVRDISELRRRDRLLLSKDATIAEIHHRVKNNLQTISSLLRLQGRRLVAPEARQAIDESVRRIRSIAIVHEILSQVVATDVPFEDILRPLVRMVEEGLVSSDHPVRFSVEGVPGDLPSAVATALAVVLTELMQNAVEHGLPGGTDPAASVSVIFERDADDLTVIVADNGVGVAKDFAIEDQTGLGLTIVRSLIENDLGGTISIDPAPAGGTEARVYVPALHGWAKPQGLASDVGRRQRRR